MDNTRLNHLEELKGSDYKIAEGAPDIQGWKIVDYTGEKIGKVQDMLFDKAAQKVRYIITHLNDTYSNLGDRDVLIPIGKAQLNISDEEVVISDLTLAQLSSLPSYTAGDITPEQEYAIRNTFLGSIAGGVTSGIADYNRDTFYDNKDFDEDRFYNRGDYADRTTGINTSDADLSETSNLDENEDLGDDLSLEDDLDLEDDDLNLDDDLDTTRDIDRTDDGFFDDSINNPNKI